MPARFQEPLLGAANDLVLRIHCAPPPAPVQEDGRKKGKERHGKHDKGKGHGKGKHHGGED